MFSFFKKSKSDAVKEREEDVDIVDSLISDNSTKRVAAIDYEELTKPIEKKGSSGLKVLTLDDITESDFLFSMDFLDIEKEYGIKLEDIYTFVKCLGPKAGFIAHHYIETHDDITYAILDITLDYAIKLNDGTYVEYDGVDIALELLEKFPDIKLVFCSAHAMNRMSSGINKYITKFENATGKNIENYYINKNADRKEYFVDFFGLRNRNE